MAEASDLNYCTPCGRKVSNLQGHNLRKHRFDLHCDLCGEILGDAVSLNSHVSGVHGQQVGYHQPNDEVFEKLKAEAAEEDEALIRKKLDLFKIQLPGTTVIPGEYYFSFYNYEKERTEMMAYVMTENNLRKLIETGANHELRNSSNVPCVRAEVDEPNTPGFDLTHGVASASKLASREENDATFDVKNLFAGRKLANNGPLSTFESHKRIVRMNWPGTLGLRQGIFPDDPEKVTVRGVKLDKPSHFVDIILMGEYQYQTFVVENKDPDPRLHHHYLYYKKTMEEVLSLSSLTVSISPTQLPSWKSAELYKCRNVCRATFATERKRDLHEYLCKNSKCPRCKQTFAVGTSDQDFFNHVAQHSPLICPQPTCQKELLTKRGLAEHKKTHGEPNFLCPKCGKTFVINKYLSQHMQLHIEGKTFQCTKPGCNKMFQTHRQRLSHQRKQHLKVGGDSTRTAVLARGLVKFGTRSELS